MKIMILYLFFFITSCSLSTNDPGKRSRHTAVVYKGSMYVLGGAKVIDHNFSHLGDFWAYNFLSKKWKVISSKNNLPARLGHTAVVYKKKMYVFGGFNFDQRYLNDLWEFDFPKSTWKKLKSGATKRYMHVMTVHKGIIYIYGGFKGVPDTVLSDLWKYSIKTGNWVKLKGVSKKLRPTGVLEDSKWYLFSSNYLDTDPDLIIYDFEHKVWRKKSKIYDKVYFTGTGLIKSNFFVLLGGGDNDGYNYNLYENIFCLNLKSKKMHQKKTKLKIKRRLHSQVTFNDKVYIYGGQSYHQNDLGDLIEFNLNDIKC